MDTLNGPIGFDVGVSPFPGLHFSVRNGELIPNYSNSRGGLMYDSPPPARRPPKLQRQSSLEERNRKKYPNIHHSPPMKKKSLSSSPPISEHEHEDLVNDFVHIDLKGEKENDAEKELNGAQEHIGAEKEQDGEQENIAEPNVKKEKDTEQESPPRKKLTRKVSFADSVGKDLCKVKVYEDPEYEAPAKPNRPIPDLKNLELVFPLPAADSEIFKSRYEKNHVILERLNLGTVNITGRIRIKPLPNGEQRRVAVRYTKNGWMSFTKQPARFFQTVKPEEDDEESKKEDKVQSETYDRYTFEITVDRHSMGVQFFITSVNSRGKAEYEDNNEGENYTVINPNYFPPQEDDEEEDGWNSWMNDDNEWCNDFY